MEVARGNKSCTYIMSTDLQRTHVRMDKTGMKMAAALGVQGIGLIFIPFKFPLLLLCGPLVQ